MRFSVRRLRDNGDAIVFRRVAVQAAHRLFRLRRLFRNETGITMAGFARAAGHAA